MQQGCGPGCTTLGAIAVLILLACVWLGPTFAQQHGVKRTGVLVPAARR